MKKEVKYKIVEYLSEGNSKEDLICMLLDRYTNEEKLNLLKEIEEFEKSYEEYNS